MVKISFLDPFDEKIYEILVEKGPKSLVELSKMTGQNNMSLFSIIGRLLTRRLVESFPNNQTVRFRVKS